MPTSLGRRLPSQILYELLCLAAAGEGRTRMMYGANLSHALLTKYLAFLERRGYLEPDQGTRYKLTAKGRGLLQDLSPLVRAFKSEELPPPR